jgi:hypothetical protein
MLSRNLGYMAKDEFVQLEELRKEVGKLLRGIIQVFILRLATCDRQVPRKPRLVGGVKGTI